MNSISRLQELIHPLVFDDCMPEIEQTQSMNKSFKQKQTTFFRVSKLNYLKISYKQIKDILCYRFT